MKILIFTNHQLGLYKFRRELLERLVDEKHRVYVSVPEDEFTEELKAIGVKVINNKYLDRRGTNPVHDFRLMSYYKSMVKKLKPDVVLTYTIKPNVYGGIVCGNLGVPYIANVTGLGTSMLKGGVVQKISIVLYRMGLKKAKTVFFQNKENLSFALKHKMVSHSHKILPGSGVNLEQYSYLPYPETKEIHFLFVARIMKEKGIEEYLAAAKEIRKEHPETVFHVCGSYEDEYERTIKNAVNKKTIVYEGFVKDMSDMYRISSCIIHPSYYPEGMSNILLEGCASGRPVIATSRPGCGEIVDDGINGFVIKEKDVCDLIKKIETFLSLDHSKRQQMGLKAREKVEKEFDRRIVINSYMKEIAGV